MKNRSHDNKKWYKFHGNLIINTTLNNKTTIYCDEFLQLEDIDVITYWCITSYWYCVTSYWYCIAINCYCITSRMYCIISHVYCITNLISSKNCSFREYMDAITLNKPSNNWRCVCMCLWVYACVYVCVFVYQCLCVYIYLSLCVCLYVSLYVVNVI